MPVRRITWGHLGEMMRFALVGGSGVIVNMVAFIVLRKLLGDIHPEDVFLPLRPTDFNIRWIHVLSSGAFVVANLWNFELNRIWTFRSGERHSRTRFGRFFTIGLVAQGIGLLILTALTHPHSPVELPTSIFDGSTGLRSRYYWAQVIMIVCTTPLSFLLNRFWTFGRHRDDRRVESATPA